MHTFNNEHGLLYTRITEVHLEVWRCIHAVPGAATVNSDCSSGVRAVHVESAQLRVLDVLQGVTYTEWVAGTICNKYLASGHVVSYGIFS